MIKIQRGRGRPRKKPIENNFGTSFFGPIPRKPRTKKMTKVVTKQVTSGNLLSRNDSYTNKKSCKLEHKKDSSRYEDAYPPLLSMIDIPGPIPNLDDLCLDANMMNELFEDLPDF